MIYFALGGLAVLSLCLMLFCWKMYRDLCNTQDALIGALAEAEEPDVHVVYASGEDQSRW